MKKKGGGWVSAVVIGVPLIIAIIFAVLMTYINISKWPGGIRANLFWQSEEMAELKDKLQLSFDALTDGLEIFRKKLAKVIEEY